MPWGSLLVSRVACLFNCPCFSNVFVLDAGAFSSKLIGELMAVLVRSLVTPSISVFPSPNVCVSLPLGLLVRLCFGCTVVSLGLVLGVPSSLPPSVAFVVCTAVFLALSWFCLSVCVFLLFAPIGRITGCTVVFLVLISFYLSLRVFLLVAPLGRPLLAALLFSEKGLSECGPCVYALFCLICKQSFMLYILLVF